MEKTLFGVLGVSGHFLKRIVSCLDTSEGALFAGVASRDPAKARQAIGLHKLPAAYENYDALLAAAEIQAVYIPLPNHLHAEWIIRAAQAGKHVLCEKPLALTAEDALRASAAAEASHVFLMEGFMYKFHPQWRHVRELAGSGEIGQISSIHTHFTYDNSDSQNIRNRKDAGGGGLLDIGCYAVSVPRFLLGREPVRVSGNLVMDEGSGVDSLASGLLDFGAVHASFTVGTKAAPFQRVYIQGTRGRLEVSTPFNPDPLHPAEVTVLSGNAKRINRLPPADHYRLMFEKFAEAVRGWAPLPVNPDDAVKNMRVLDALKKSHETGTWISL